MIRLRNFGLQVEQPYLCFADVTQRRRVPRGSSLVGVVALGVSLDSVSDPEKTRRRGGMTSGSGRGVNLAAKKNGMIFFFKAIRKRKRRGGRGKSAVRKRAKEKRREEGGGCFINIGKGLKGGKGSTRAGKGTWPKKGGRKRAKFK